MLHGDTGLLQYFGIADAGELQDMRRAHGSRRKDHFMCRVNPVNPAVARIHHASCSLPLESHMVNEGVGDDTQV